MEAITKACLVPLILAVYISGAANIYFLVTLALVLGWLGDVFLLKITDIRFFRLGLASFLLGHICYIPAILHFSGKLQMFPFIISLAAAVPLGYLIRRLVRPSKEMNIPAFAYETVILLMAVSSLQLFLSQGAPFGALVFAGALCFLVSDTLLAFFTFRTMPRYGQFFVMFTYIPAQLLIVLGLSGL